jgi:hypothetical protein
MDINGSGQVYGAQDLILGTVYDVNIYRMVFGKYPPYHSIGGQYKVPAWLYMFTWAYPANNKQQEAASAKRLNADKELMDAFWSMVILVDRAEKLVPFLKATGLLSEP